MTQQQTLQQDLKNYTTQNNTEETHKQESNLAENKPLNNGLVIRYRHDRGWFTTLGDTVVTEFSQTEQEQITQLEEDYYKVVQKIAIHIYKVMNKMTETQRDILTDGL